MTQQFHSYVFTQEGWEHMPIKRPVQNVHRSFIRNSQNLEAAQQSTNRRTHNHTVRLIQWDITEQWKETWWISKKFCGVNEATMCASNCGKFQNRQNYTRKKTTRTVFASERGWLGRAWGRVWVAVVYSILLGSCITQVPTLVKTHWMVHLRCLISLKISFTKKKYKAWHDVLPSCPM